MVSTREELSAIVRDLYALVRRLEELYPGMRFTPDGYLVGSIAEVYAAETYGITLYEDSSHPKHDGYVGDCEVQIKCTQGERITLGSRPGDCPDHLIALHLSKEGGFEEIYNGYGWRVWDDIVARKPQKTSQTKVSLVRLRELSREVTEDERIAKRRCD